MGSSVNKGLRLTFTLCLQDSKEPGPVAEWRFCAGKSGDKVAKLVWFRAQRRNAAA